MLPRGTILLLVNIVFFACLALTALAQSKRDERSPGLSYDCTKVTIDFTNDQSLTQEEKLELMDKALFESLSRFDACHISQATTSSRTTSNAGGTAGAEGSGQQTGTKGSGGRSVASVNMSGEEKPAESQTSQEKDTSSSSGLAETGSKGQHETEIVKHTKGTPSQPTVLDNGKIPDDIPPADNDSILEGQIRQAAIIEKDPKIKAKLWQEYRKYKGLPPKK